MVRNLIFRHYAEKSNVTYHLVIKYKTLLSRSKSIYILHKLIKIKGLNLALDSLTLFYYC